MLHCICPNCNHEIVELFYSIKETPVVSTLLSNNREEALNVKMQPIDLVICLHCGFIFNKLYDLSFHAKLEDHADQQGYSSIFNNFITNLTKRIVTKYQIKNKTVLEIGCGKGDFLKLICSEGNNVGIGIDPSLVIEKILPNPKINYIKSYYSKNHKNIKSDLICCRHTLEHIPSSGTFINLINSNISNQESQVILFEVPDTTRILKEIAFWDIYYEHCSYFTLNSIQYLFENNHFWIEDIRLDYNNQYIILEALSKKEQSNYFSKEAVTETVNLCRAFNSKLNMVKWKWNQQFLEFEREDKNVFLWGGGSKPVGFLTLLENYQIIKAIVDINPKMDGKFIPGFGIEVISPKRLINNNPDVIIIMNQIYLDEIKSILNNINLYPQLIAL